MEDNVTPLSAPPFPNYRHQRLPQQFPPHPNEHLIGNKNAAVNFHHSVCHTPQAAPFTQRSLSFDQSQTHFYQMQQPPNEISNTLHCQQRYEVCNFMHPRNDCYEGPQSEPMAPHFHPMHYYSHEPNRYPDERQFFRDDLMTQKGSASSSAPNHSNYAEYWADFEQIKSNTDRPFMNRSRDDDIEMARIVADLKRSAESDAVPMFSTLPHEAIQHRHPGSNVPSQFFLNDGTVTGGRFVQTMRKPVERAEADSTFWEEDVTASARTSSDSTLGNPKNEYALNIYLLNNNGSFAFNRSPVHRTNTNPILVQVLNTDPPTFIRNNGAGPKHFVSSPNIHQTQVGIKTEGVSTDVDTKREQFHLGHFQGIIFL
jgi:hypothetical protein